MIIRNQNLLTNIDLVSFKKQLKNKSLKQQTEIQSNVEKSEQDGQDYDLDEKELIQKLQKQNKAQNVSVPYNLVYKHFYGRETLMFSLSQSELKPFRRNHTYGYSVKEFKVGLKFTAFLTYSNEFYYCLTSEYVDTFSQKLHFQTKKDIKEFSVIGKNIIQVLTMLGTIIVIQYDETTKQFIEQPIKITQLVPIKQFANSYYLNVMIIDYEQTQISRNQINLALNSLIYGNRVDGEEILSIPIDQMNEQVIGLVMFIFDLNIMNLNDSIRYKKIIDYPFDQVTSMSVGSQSFYFLAPNQQVYQSEKQTVNPNQNLQLDVINQESPIVKTVLVDFFKNKSVVELYSGLQYFFALARKEIKSIQDWANEEVVKWLDDLGFQDYSKVVRYNEYNGEEFSQLAIDKTFQKETLGLFREDLSIKLNTEISKASKSRYLDYVLYGWGKNDWGQLGTFISNNIAMATTIPIPKFEVYDKIIQIECGWKNSVILTERGRVFITEDKQDKTEKLQQQDKQQDQQKSKKGEQRKKKQSFEQEESKQATQRKKSKQMKNDESQEVQQNHKWVEITDKIKIQKNKQQYEKFSVSLTKEWLCILGVCMDNEKLSQLRQNNIQQTKKESKAVQIKKFKPANKILDRILWDTSLKKEDFLVGYEDRFLGIMEISIDEYMKSEVKDHRIQYFKRKDELIWDRQSKLDLF